MKYAVPVSGGVMCPHFGHCEQFALIDVDEEKREIRKNEQRVACKMLGIRQFFMDLDNPVLRVDSHSIDTVKRIIKDVHPDIIFLPPEDDIHPTHQKVSQILKIALGRKKIERRYYETWKPIDRPNFIFFFDRELMDVKIKAMRVYKSQIERTDFLNGVIGLNMFRGSVGQEMIGGFGKEYRKRLFSDGRIVYGEAFYIERK